MLRTGLLLSCLMCFSGPSAQANFASGQAAMEQGQYAQAHQHFQQELQLRPGGEHAQASRWLSARCLLEMRDYATFVTEADAYHSAFPGTEQDYWLRYQQALTHKYQGRAAASIAPLQALSAESNLAQDLVVDIDWSILECLLDARDYATFSTQAAAFAAAHPGSERRHQARIWQALTSAWQGNRPAAILALEALAADPELPIQYARQAHLQAIQLRYEAGDLQDFEQAATAFIETYAQTAEAWTLRLQLAGLPVLSGDYASARDRLLAVLALKTLPEGFKPELLSQLALCHLHLGEHAALATLVGDFTQQQPHHPIVPRLLLWQALSLKQQGELAQAGVVLNQLINQFPQDALQAEAQWERAQGLIALGHFELFAQQAQDFLAGFPEGERTQWMRFWLACVPLWQNNPAGSVEALTTVADDAGIHANVRSEAQWKLIEALRAAQQGEVLRARIELYLAEHPQAANAAELRYWQAQTSAWSGDYAAAALALCAYADNAEFPAALREAARVEQIAAHYTAGEADAVDGAADRFRNEFPDSTQAAYIAYLRALAPIPAHRLQDAVERTNAFLSEHATSPFAQDVAYWRVRVTHDSEQFNQVDAAADYYQLRFGDTDRADYVAYVKMLVPLNGIEKDWDEAIRRCQAFKELWPQSAMLANANLNLGWALCAKAAVLEGQGLAEQAAQFRQQGQAAMQACRGALPADHPKADIDRLESYYLENDYAALEQEARRQIERYGAQASRHAVGKYYLGLARARQDDAAGAIEAFQSVMNTQLEPASYDAYILTSATWWVMGLQAGRGEDELARGTYQFARNLPETSLKPIMLEQYANLAGAAGQTE